jgi:hypothetical protein
MKQSMWAGLAALSCLALLAATAPVRALMIAPAPVPQRVALAQVVVVGKVTGFADKTVKAPAFPGADDKVEYQVAIVQVGDALQGAKDVKEIKVGFIPPGGPGGGPGGPIRPGIRPRGGVNLLVDQEYILFLNPHADAPFYVLDGFAGALPKKDNPNFDKDLDEVKKSVKLLADPMASLKAKEAEDRTLTAEMLVARYRMPRASAKEPKTEDLGAEESKLILQALADADWDAKPAPGRVGIQMSPLNSFFQLGLTEKDGWKQPQDGNELQKAAKKWLKDNADKYRIQKLVVETKDDKKDEKKDGK